MSLLSSALNYARQGFYVFPIMPGVKAPPAVKWKHESTTDEARIRQWWSENPDYNIGLDCGKSDLGVIDIDVKNNKGGEASIEDYKPLPETLAIITPTGGMHLIYRGDIPTTVEKLGPGLDTRGKGGFTLLPPSKVDGALYTPLNGLSVAPFPVQIAEKLEQHVPRETTKVEPLNSDQIDIAFRTAIDFLSTTPPAIEGHSGDHTTFKTIAHIRDIGITKSIALHLLAHYFNPRCEPPWGFEELKYKVENVYEYAQNPLGSKNPYTVAESNFTPLDQDEQSVRLSKHTFSKETEPDFESMHSRHWIYGERYMAGAVTITAAPGGASKSTITHAEMIAIASGQNILNQVVRKPGPTLVYNLEDDLQEMRRRHKALENRYNIEADVHLLSGIDYPITLFKDTKTGCEPTRDIYRLRELIGDLNLRAITLDPFVSLHNVNENDNMAIDLVSKTLVRIGKEFNCAISLVHHTRKLSPNEIVSMDSLRGAGALAAASRIAHVVHVMNKKEAKTRGISEFSTSTSPGRLHYIRMMPVKGNFSAPEREPKWFLRESETLMLPWTKPDGSQIDVAEKIGVISPITPPNNGDDEIMEIE